MFGRSVKEIAGKFSAWMRSPVQDNPVIRGDGLFYDPDPGEKTPIRAYFRDFHRVLKSLQLAVFTPIKAQITSI